MEKMLKFFWPIGFLFFVWCVFASPYFLQSKVPYPSSFQVSFFGPWNEYPDYAIPAKNNALSDVVNQIYPWKHFTIEELKKGQLPLWNPYSFSGTPHLANYQSAVFSPVNLFFFILPFIDAWSVVILLQPLLAGLFMYLFMRELPISKIGSLIAAVAFMFCGFMTVWMPYGTLAMAVAFLPLALYAVEKTFTKKSKWSLLLLVISLCFSFFSGHFQMSLYVLGYTVLYLLFKLFQTKDTKAFFLTLGAITIALLITFLQLLPSLIFYRNAVRSELFTNSEGIPWYYLVTVFAPDFFGNPVTRNDWIGHYAEWASFIGIIPLMLALGAIFKKNRKGTITFFFLAGLFSLVLALDTPLQQLFAMLKIPVFSTSIPSRIIVLFSFSFITLAGFGFDTVMDLLKKNTYKEFILPFSTKMLFLIIAWGSVLLLNILPSDKALLADRNLLLPTFLFGLIFFVIALTFFIKRRGLVLVFIVLILLLTTFDSLRFASKWMPFEEKQFVFPTMPVIAAMQKNIGYGRVYGDFGAFVDTYYHLPSIEGYDPLYSRRYGEFLQSAQTGTFSPALRSEAHLDKSGKYTQRVLDLLGVSLIYQPISHTNRPWAFPVWEHPSNFPTIYRDSRIAVFRNTTVMPRVKLFYNYEVITDPKAVMKRFYQDDFDYRNTLLLEEDPKIVESTGQEAKGKAEIVSYSPKSVTIAVFTDKQALLFLSDSYYPAWKAKVNDKDERIYTADYTLRAVIVPKGKSTVEFYYRGLF